MKALGMALTMVMAFIFISVALWHATMAFVNHEEVEIVLLQSAWDDNAVDAQVGIINVKNQSDTPFCYGLYEVEITLYPKPNPD